MNLILSFFSNENYESKGSHGFLSRIFHFKCFISSLSVGVHFMVSMGFSFGVWLIFILSKVFLHHSGGSGLQAQLICILLDAFFIILSKESNFFFLKGYLVHWNDNLSVNIFRPLFLC